MPRMRLLLDIKILKRNGGQDNAKKNVLENIDGNEPVMYYSVYHIKKVRCCIYECHSSYYGLFEYICE